MRNSDLAEPTSRDGIRDATNAPFPHQTHGDDTTWVHIAEHAERNPDVWKGLEPYLARWGIAGTALAESDAVAGLPSEQVNDDAEATPENKSLQVLDDYIASLHTQFPDRASSEPDMSGYVPKAPDEVFAAIRSDEITGSDLNNFVRNVSGFYDSGYDYGSLPLLLKEAQPQTLREAYFADESTIAEGNGFKHVVDVLCADEVMLDLSAPELLRKVYGLEDQLELKQAGEHSSDPNVEQAIVSPVFLQNVVTDYADRRRPKQSDESYDKKLLAEEDKHFTQRFLQLGVGLPEADCKDFAIASKGRITDQDTKQLAWGDLSNALLATAEHAQNLGTDTLIELREKTGIINFDIYEHDQLLRMSRLIHGDPELIHDLKQGDVTVVFTDAMGDHNGGLQGVPKQFENPSKRTLYFEVTKEADFYAYMKLLGGHNIKPSTMVVSAHGKPGSMVIGTDQQKFVISNIDARPYPSILYRKGALNRLVNEFMQDSRGIDEPEETIGRRRVVLDGCELGLPGEKSADNPSAPGSKEAIPETVLRLVDSPRVDIYAASTKVYSHSTDKGIRFYDGRGKKRGEAEIPSDMLRFALNSVGVPTQTRIPELQLWNKPRRQRSAADV